MDEGNKMNVPDTAAGPNMAQASSGGNKMMLWLIVAVVVLLIIGGVYYYLNSSKPEAPAEPSPAQTTKVQEDLEDDLNAVNVDNGENDFSCYFTYFFRIFCTLSGVALPCVFFITWPTTKLSAFSFPAL